MSSADRPESYILPNTSLAIELLMVPLSTRRIRPASAAGVSGTPPIATFRSFIVRSKGERVGRNPKTGVEVPIDPRRVMVFKPSNVLKAHINGETFEGED